MSFDPNITVDSIATLVAGVIALLVYGMHKRDEKKKAATILVGEMRQAEQAINQIKVSGVTNDYTKLMGDNNWNKYKHLFAKILDSDEIDEINNFYLSCEAIESQLKLSRSWLPISMEEKVRITQQKLVELSSKGLNAADFDLEKKKILDLSYWPNEAWFEPNAPKVKLLNYINAIPRVMSGNGVEKLKLIAK